MKKVLVLLLALCLILGLAGGALAEEEITVGYTVQSMENAYFVSIVDGMKAAAKDRGINLIVSDAAADASKHINHIEDFIAQGVDAIIISPVDQEAPVDAVKQAQEAGIPVISLFICAPFGDRIRRRMEIEGLGPKEAEDTIRKIDKQRKKYYDTYTGRNWGVPENYDFCINSSVMGIEETAEHIITWTRGNW